MANDEVNETADGEPLSEYMSAYSAPAQNTDVVLDGRVEVSVPPPEIIRGDLVWDEGRWKEAEEVVLLGRESGTYVYFIEGTPGYVRLEYTDLRERAVWRRVSEAADDAG